jgi:hypothetical protein
MYICTCNRYIYIYIYIYIYAHTTPHIIYAQRYIYTCPHVHRLCCREIWAPLVQSQTHTHIHYTHTHIHYTHTHIHYTHTHTLHTHTYTTHTHTPKHICIYTHTHTDAAVVNIVRRCSRLRELGVVGCRLGDQSAEGIASLRTLRALCVEIDATPQALTDHGRAVLYSLPESVRSCACMLVYVLAFVLCVCMYR